MRTCASRSGDSPTPSPYTVSTPFTESMDVRKEDAAAALHEADTVKGLAGGDPRGERYLEFRPYRRNGRIDRLTVGATPFLL
jgi:hypothetical protein